MNKIETKFFDSYKKLDLLCGKMFNIKNGVSEYIATMDKCFEAGQNKIPNWKQDYKTIKHLRWVRNKIAHEETSPCTKEDLVALNDFIKKIEKEKDPITLLYFSKNKKAKTARNTYKISAFCFFLASIFEYIAAGVYFYNSNTSLGTMWLCIASSMLCVGTIQTQYSKKTKK